jgi:hypothetical protein
MQAPGPIAQAGTTNRGGGGGGSGGPPSVAGGNGGSGVVILSVPTALYSGTYGPPANVTVAPSGSNTIITFTGTGTYTA